MDAKENDAKDKNLGTLSADDKIIVDMFQKYLTEDDQDEDEEDEDEDMIDADAQAKVDESTNA